MIKFEGAIIRRGYVGYAYVYKNKMNSMWVLHIAFKNENQHEAYLEFSYESKNEAEGKLNKLFKELNI